MVDEETYARIRGRRQHLTLGLVRGIAAGIGTFLAFYFGLQDETAPRSVGHDLVSGHLVVYLAVGGWAAFQRWLNAPKKNRNCPRRHYFSTTDHKVVGIQYCAAFFLFFTPGSNLIMRDRIGQTRGTGSSADLTTPSWACTGIGMIIVALTAIIGGFGNYFVPLQIRAKRLRRLRLNALSFWPVLPAARCRSSAFNGGVDFWWTALRAASAPMGNPFFLLAFATAGFSSVLGPSTC